MTQGGFGGDPFGGTPFGDPFNGPVGHPPTVATPPGSPPPQVPAQTNTLATLSVVFAIVFAPAGAVLGHLAMSQIARTGQRGRDRALIGITLSYIVIVVAIAGLVVWSVAGGDESPTTPATSGSAPTTSPSSSSVTPPSNPTAPVPPKVDVAALPGILLPLDELRTLISDPGQMPLFTSDGLVEPRPDRGSFPDTTCVGSFVRGTPMAYQSSEPTKYYGADSGNTSTGQQIGQGAAMFPDDAAANTALNGYLQMWHGCAGQSTPWTLTNGRVVTATFGAPEEIAPGLTAVRTTVPELPSVQFIHVIAVKANVLVDNTFGSVKLADTPQRVTQAMLDRIPN